VQQPPSPLLQPPSAAPYSFPSRTAEDWANQPRSANDRRAEARRQAARRAAHTAAQRRAEQRGSRMLRAVGPSIAKASGSMAIATLISRITGFLSKMLLTTAVGLGVINDAYNVANTLPNMLLEFILGGVLTSVAVPVLVRAQKDDPDGGNEYTQRLITMATVLLVGATVLAVIAAPLLVRILVSGDTATYHVATVLAYLLLPEILFYGLSALFNAVLNARNVFSPTAWAPVLNNVLVIGTLLLYLLMPGQVTLNPASLSDPKLLVLGVGTTLGIVVQAIVVVKPLLRTGFRFRWRWGWDPRLTEFGGLALWMLGYVAVSQLAVIVVGRVATGADPGSYAIYTYSWLLVQLPFGVIGFSLLTAILPRMSRAAAEGDTQGLVDDLSFGTRTVTVLLGPISGLMTVLGPAICVGLFSLGHSSVDGATRMGLALTVSAFGLLPYTVTMVQMRVFYAMKDSRTPTLIMVIMVVVKIPLYYLCAAMLDGDHVVYGLAFVNSLGYVVGAVVGQAWLRGRLGRLDTVAVLVTIGKTALASIWGAGAALLVERGFIALGLSGGARAWPSMILGTIVGLAVLIGVMWLLRVRELKPAMNRITQVVRRR
jgi:putative peptidoglycan lipid II flippase